jgi:DNA repair protein RadD
MEIDARYYQRAAVRETWSYMKSSGGNPCICIPTGGGKTIVMAMLAKDCLGWGKRIVIATHNQELLLQIEATLLRYGMPCGIYSAGLGRRDTEQDIILVGIQSGYRCAGLFGFRDVVFIDEAHRISPEDNSMYCQLFHGLMELSPKLRIIGLTATPYRMNDGLICSPENWLNQISYEVSVKELIDNKFLCPLRSKSSQLSIDTSQLKVKINDFSESQQEDMFLARANEIIADLFARCQTYQRKSILVFCAGVKQAFDVKERLQKLGEVCGVITGDTKDSIRKEYLDAFKSQEIRWLVNVNVLTEGFDAPCVDTVALLRATVSPGLFYQMSGRGLRLHPSKEYCLICDYGENLDRHGPIDAITPPGKKGSGGAKTKSCPTCEEVLPLRTDICPDCGYVFADATERASPWEKISNRPTDADVISDNKPPEWITVGAMDCDVNPPRVEGKLPTLKVSFYANPHRLGYPVVSVWLCAEHEGFARFKAETIWSRLNGLDPLPHSVTEAHNLLLERLASGDILPPTSILVGRDPKSPKFKTLLDMAWEEGEPDDDTFDIDEFRSSLPASKTKDLEDFF